MARGGGVGSRGRHIRRQSQPKYKARCARNKLIDFLWSLPLRCQPPRGGKLPKYGPCKRLSGRDGPNLCLFPRARACGPVRDQATPSGGGPLSPNIPPGGATTRRGRESKNNNSGSRAQKEKGILEKALRDLSGNIPYPRVQEINFLCLKTEEKIRVAVSCGTCCTK